MYRALRYVKTTQNRCVNLSELIVYFSCTLDHLQSGPMCSQPEHLQLKGVTILLPNCVTPSRTNQTIRCVNMTTTLRSRRISSSSGSIAIENEDFISGMLAALTNKEVIGKLQAVIVNDLRKEVAYLRCVIEKKDATIESLTKRVDDLEVALDDHEQYSSRNSLRLFGLVESENEEITKRTIDVLNESMNPKLSPPLRLEEIDRIHRVGPRDKPSRLVLVKFATYASRRRIYKARVGLNPNPRRPRWDEREPMHQAASTQT